ncbi:MAG: hypothetical protein IJW59_04500 [Clostridia bacterium]|nr:hypothetical protein [Clostridia bacterium]
MKKKRAIRNYVLVSIFVVIVFLLSFISFPVPGTNYNFVGLANLHQGLELGGGVKNTYNLEVADWYKGTKESAYRKAIDRVQELLDKNYADAKVYLSGEDQITVEVPDTFINNNYLVGLIEMKSESGESAPALVTGEDIEKVEYTLNGTVHGVYVEFTKVGKEKFRELTKTVSASSEQTMYIYMNKDYENPFSQTTVTEENTMGFTFISGSSIVDKKSGQEYANKIESALIGVNMSSDVSAIEITGVFGEHTRLVMTIATIVLVVASIAVAVVLFRELGMVSMLSVLFALAVSVLISAICDMQITFAGWLGFVSGYILNFVLHMHYLGVIKKEYASGKKFTVSFTSGYKTALFNILDTLIIVAGTMLLVLIVPSSLVRAFSYNMLMTLAGTAFTSMYLNKVLAVNYTAFNARKEKKVNFAREVEIDEVK